MKGRSLASRLLSKKGDKRVEQLTFGAHAQSSQRRGGSLPTFDLDETSTPTYAGRHQSLPPPFAPQAAVEPSLELPRPSMDDIEALQECVQPPRLPTLTPVLPLVKHCQYQPGNLC